MPPEHAAKLADGIALLHVRTYAVQPASISLQWKFLGAPDSKYKENISIDCIRISVYDKSPM